MARKLYSVRDRKANTFSPPFAAATHEDAMRSIVASLTPTSMLSKFPDDYSLYYVGTFNDDTGTMMIPELPEFIVEVSTLTAVKDEVKNG